MNHVADLSDSFEYFVGYNGQSTSRPWGAKAEGFALFNDYNRADVGIDITTVTIPANASRNTVDEETLNVSGTLGVASSLAANTPVGNWCGEILRLGTKTQLVKGYAVVIRATAYVSTTLAPATITVRWIVSPGTGASTPAGYLIRPDFKWASYPQVRVLTPYQPVCPTDDTGARDIPYPDPADTFANDGRALQLPSPYTVPAGVTSFEDLGLLLPFTFKEGIDGYGISDGSDSSSSPATHAISSIASGVWTFANAIPDVDLLNGGYLVVDWEDGGVMKRSWASITDSTATTFTPGSWLGDGAINDGDHAKVKRYTAWVPYWNDSPHSFLPGEGFAYPNNDMQPHTNSIGLGAGGCIRNRPRGLTTAAYGDKLGDMLFWASRLSAAIGKRINIVYLGINAAGLANVATMNLFGFTGRLGWWDHQEHFTFMPGIAASAWSRIERLISTILPNAMAAEGNTRTPKFLGWVVHQGQTDANYGLARRHYHETIRAFLTKIRRLIDSKGYSPYSNGAKLPFVQSKIARIPYCLQGTFLYYGVSVSFDGDINNYVNDAIVENAISDGFGDVVEVNDLPRILTDPGHYHGAGEAAKGHRIGNALVPLIDYALGFGSAALQSPDSVTDLCNLALRSIGADPITSILGTDARSKSCAAMFPQARDTLLQMRQWGFALRRVKLHQVRMVEESLYNHWGYCYVLPARALKPIAVVPPAVLETPVDTDPTTTPVLTASYASTFTAAYNSEDTQTDLPIVDVTAIERVPYTLEKSTRGGRLLFTNQEQATLQFVDRVPDVSRYSPLFRDALVLWLASKLAPDIIRGAQGEKIAAEKSRQAGFMLRSAATSDAQQQRQVQPAVQNFIPDHMRRGAF